MYVMSKHSKHLLSCDTNPAETQRNIISLGCSYSDVEDVLMIRAILLTFQLLIM